MELTCTNCESELQAQYAFCPGCGQKTRLHRLGMHELIHDAVHYFTHADKGLIQLLRDLIVKRGIVALEFMNGKRKKYFPPLNFFLIVAAILVFTSTFQKESEPVDVMKKYPQIAKIDDPVQREQTKQAYLRAIKVERFMAKNSNVMAMLALPLTAFFYFIFFRKQRYNYIEHLVACMYMLGFCLLVYGLVMMPIGRIFDINWIFIGLMALQIFYGTSFYMGFMQRTGAWNYVKIMGIGILSGFVWTMLTGGLARIYIVNGLWGLLA